jgi:hypothetical protein
MIGSVRKPKARASGLVRWGVAAAMTFLAFAFVQSLRHPARLWSPGLMGRVLAWGMEVDRGPDQGRPSS